MFAYYGICYALPEFQRLVGELLLDRRDNLGDGIERVEVDDEVLFLPIVRVTTKQGSRVLTETLEKGLLPRV